MSNGNYIFEKAYKKVNDGFKKLIKDVAKGSFNDETLNKVDSVITIYYEVFKRNYSKLFEQRSKK